MRALLAGYIVASAQAQNPLRMNAQSPDAVWRSFHARTGVRRVTARWARSRKEAGRVLKWQCYNITFSAISIDFARKFRERPVRLLIALSIAILAALTTIAPAA